MTLRTLVSGYRRRLGRVEPTADSPAQRLAELAGGLHHLLARFFLGVAVATENAAGRRRRHARQPDHIRYRRLGFLCHRLSLPTVA